MSQHHMITELISNRLRGQTWSLVHRLRLAKTVMDAIRIYANRGPLVPGYAKGLIPSAERIAQNEIFDTFQARVNELITRQLHCETISNEDKRFYAINTMRNCRAHLPGTSHALENYLNDAPNPFVKNQAQKTG